MLTLLLITWKINLLLLSTNIEYKSPPSRLNQLAKTND